MQIADFTTAHIAQAIQIALQNYEEERRHVPALPHVDMVPNFTAFAENGLGVAAFDGQTMLGFLCSVSPFKNAFRSTDATGVFSPMGANGALGNNRAEVYARMYQAAGEKWVRTGATSHAICLYAHDTETQQQFFRYGFGLRCINGIRAVESLNVTPCERYEFAELEKDEYHKVFPLDLMLNKYQCTSPYFLSRKPNTLESFVDSYTQNAERFFVAKYQEDLCAGLMSV